MSSVPTIVVACPECGKQYRVPVTLAGKQAGCQACGAAITIPTTAAADAPTMPAMPAVSAPAPAAAQAAAAAAVDRIVCTGCNRQFAYNPQLAGRQIACPGCGGPIDVPHLPAAPAASAGPAPDLSSFFAEELKASEEKQRLKELADAEAAREAAKKGKKRKKKTGILRLGDDGDSPAVKIGAAVLAAAITIFSWGSLMVMPGPAGGIKYATGGGGGSALSNNRTLPAGGGAYAAGAVCGLICLLVIVLFALLIAGVLLRAACSICKVDPPDLNKAMGICFVTFLAQAFMAFLLNLYFGKGADAASQQAIAARLSSVQMPLAMYLTAFIYCTMIPATYARSILVWGAQYLIIFLIGIFIAIVLMSIDFSAMV